MTKSLSPLVGITWEDAPIIQYASLNEDYKVRCVVRANPPANIDWLKESLIISTGIKTSVKLIMMGKSLDECHVEFLLNTISHQTHISE